jgi:hypothetical protein
MKFSSIPTLGALFAVASASLYTTDVAVVCSGADPTTITQTVTVTAAPYSGGSNTYVPSNRPPYVTTAGGSVTSVDYSGSQTSVWVYPTGSASHDCTVAIYEQTTVINVIIVNIYVSIVNGTTTTITSTVSGAHPTWTPPPPPPHPYHNSTSTWSSYTSSMPLSTGYHGHHSYNTTSTRSSHIHLSTGVSTHSRNGTHSTSTPTSSFTLNGKPLSTGGSSSKPYGTGKLQSSLPLTTLPAKSTGNRIPSQPTASSSTVLPNGRRANAWYA